MHAGIYIYPCSNLRFSHNFALRCGMRWA